MNRDILAQMGHKAAEELKDHQYRLLADVPGAEIWRCQTPGSIHMAFDICITRFGIAVFGDIGSLTFSVGASYGIKFLAGTDGDYIYRKLEPSSKETDFDRNGFVTHVQLAICNLVSTKYETAPAWMDESAERERHMAELEPWLLKHAKEAEIAALHVALREATAYTADSSPSAAHEWLDDHEELLEVSDTWEWNLRKPTDSVCRRLARVRHAAQYIHALKIAQQPEVTTQ
ncbi:hypothetical protein [Pseudomonas viridiflava]|uniref:hypothetical protein n=1 Tax=Pseudomonas viridiflava TaxID=33069 RepID=UPI000F03F0B2|nr:hypothetical protein [Pseudomonas viridiflava]